MNSDNKFIFEKKFRNQKNIKYHCQNLHIYHNLEISDIDHLTNDHGDATIFLTTNIVSATK